jgi:hypothetical protein
MAYIIGYPAGSNLTRYLVSDFMVQVRVTLTTPLLTTSPGNWLHAIMCTVRGRVIVGGVSCGLI